MLPSSTGRRCIRHRRLSDRIGSSSAFSRDGWTMIRLSTCDARRAKFLVRSRRPSKPESPTRPLWNWVSATLRLSFLARTAAPNLLDQQFAASRPSEKWVADITYIRTGEGWLYLAIVLDLFSRRIVGHAVS